MRGEEVGPTLTAHGPFSLFHTLIFNVRTKAKGHPLSYSDKNWRPLRNGRLWWAASDSNREPVGYEPIALPLS